MGRKCELKNCLLKPCFDEKNRVYLTYCSKYHRDLANKEIPICLLEYCGVECKEMSDEDKEKNNIIKWNKQYYGFCSKIHRDYSKKGIWICATPKCGEICEKKDNGEYYDYCSKFHANGGIVKNLSMPEKNIPQVIFPTDVVYSYKINNDYLKGVLQKYGLYLRVIELDDIKKLKKGMLIVNYYNKSDFTVSKSDLKASAFMFDKNDKENSTNEIIKHIFNNWVEEIHFYDKKQPFYEFANFYVVNVVINNITWRTTEHYYQCMKFTDEKNNNLILKHFKAIQNIKEPKEVFNYAHEHSDDVRNDWHKYNKDIGESLKDMYMKKALRNKFKIKNFRDLLLLTGNATIVEHTKNDKYWGDGGDGTGENKLGQFLMKIRKEIKNE